MAFTDSDKKQIETIVRKEIKDFMGSNTIKQFEDKLLDMVAKEIKKARIMALLPYCASNY